MKNVLLYSLLVFLGFSSCQTEGSVDDTTKVKDEISDTAAKKMNGPIDVAFQEMMVIHDEVMPKFSYMQRLKKGIKALVPGDDVAYASEIQNHELSIQKAMDDMMNWMKNIKPKAYFNDKTEAAALAYYKVETEKISKVSKDMKASIAAGESFLKTHQSK